MIKINRRLKIPEDEISFTFSTSSKPGGQNVNKVNTRATLLFDVKSSRALGERQKRVIEKKLGTRINKEGILRVSSQKYRSQHDNRKAAREKFSKLLNEALKRPPRRKPTITPPRAKARRLENKRKRGRLKKLRSPVDPSREP
jgi:ribosome-associated protein